MVHIGGRLGNGPGSGGGIPQTHIEIGADHAVEPPYALSLLLRHVQHPRRRAQANVRASHVHLLARENAIEESARIELRFHVAQLDALQHGLIGELRHDTVDMEFHPRNARADAAHRTRPPETAQILFALSEVTLARHSPHAVEEESGEAAQQQQQRENAHHHRAADPATLFRQRHHDLALLGDAHHLGTIRTHDHLPRLLLDGSFLVDLPDDGANLRNFLAVILLVMMMVMTVTVAVVMLVAHCR